MSVFESLLPRPDDDLAKILRAAPPPGPTGRRRIDATEVDFSSLTRLIIVHYLIIVHNFYIFLLFP